MNRNDRHVARVCLTQARVFRHRGSPFWRTLLTWARNAKRRSWLAPPVQPGESGRLL